MKRTFVTFATLFGFAVFCASRPAAQHQGTAQFQLVEATLGEIQSLFRL